MQVYHFTCKHCGYESKLPLGSADYADYHLFRCDKESNFVHADIHSSDFEGKCIADGSKLEEIKQQIPPIKCPRCNRDLATETNAPLADVDSTSVQ